MLMVTPSERPAYVTSSRVCRQYLSTNSCRHLASFPTLPLCLPPQRPLQCSCSLRPRSFNFSTVLLITASCSSSCICCVSSLLLHLLGHIRRQRSFIKQRCLAYYLRICPVTSNYAHFSDLFHLPARRCHQPWPSTSLRTARLHLARASIGSTCLLAT